MQNLTLIIPAKNEVESLPIFLEEINKLNYKKLIVLQREDIQTKNVILENESTKILIQKKNGYGNALIEGINDCKTEYCCIINADGSMNPSYLIDMLLKCENHDLIFASRYLTPGGGSDDDTFITLVGNKIFSFLGNLLFKLNLSDILFTYIVGKTKSFKMLDLKYVDFRLCVEIPIRAKKQNLKYTSIASYERSRIGGKKKVNAFKDGFLILIAMLKFLVK